MAERRGSSTERAGAKIVKVSHLGGIDVSYRMAKAYRQYKPTILMINSFTTSMELYRAQFADDNLVDTFNVVAIEPLGHGKTKAKATDTFTYWDSAVMAIQAMDALSIKQAFVLGTSQGGWIAARMALYSRERILGLIVVGTTMDSEHEQEHMTPFIEATTSKTETPDFEPNDEYCNTLINISFGKEVNEEVRKLWTETIKANYKGDAGRKRFREASINLRDRDSIRSRLTNIKCPVLWMQGDADAMYSVENAEKEIKLFDNSPDARVMPVEGGQHFLSWTNSAEVNAALHEFISKHSQGMKPSGRALREAVGMVEM